MGSSPTYFVELVHIDATINLEGMFLSFTELVLLHCIVCTFQFCIMSVARKSWTYCNYSSNSSPPRYCWLNGKGAADFDNRYTSMKYSVSRRVIS